MTTLDAIAKNPAKGNQAFAPTARKLIKYLETGKGKPETDLFEFLNKSDKLSKLDERTVAPLKASINTFVTDLGTKFIDVKARLNQILAEAARLTSNPFKYPIVSADKSFCIVS